MEDTAGQKTRTKNLDWGVSSDCATMRSEEMKEESLFSTNILGDFEYISGLQIDTRALAGRQASVSSSPDKSGIHSLKSWPWSV